MECEGGGEGGGGEKGGRGVAGGLGQITSEVHTPSLQSVLTGITGDWGVGVLIMIGLLGQSLMSAMGMHAEVGGWGGAKGRQSAS